MEEDKKIEESPPWAKEFDTLEEAVAALESFRAAILFGEIADRIGDLPIASEHFLLGVAALEQAKAHLRLAHYHEMRERVIL